MAGIGAFHGDDFTFEFRDIAGEVDLFEAPGVAAEHLRVFVGLAFN